MPVAPTRRVERERLDLLLAAVPDLETQGARPAEDRKFWSDTIYDVYRPPRSDTMKEPRKRGAAPRGCTAALGLALCLGSPGPGALLGMLMGRLLFGCSERTALYLECVDVLISNGGTSAPIKKIRGRCHDV